MLVFRGLTGNMLMGQFVGPFDRNFQDISAGFLPDVTDFPALNAMLGGSHFHWGAMTIGVVAVVLMIFLGLRRWRHARAEQMETEPLALFIGKMAIFSALILFITYQLASYKGLPEVLIIMAVLILIYAFVTTRTTIGAASTPSAATGWRRSCPHPHQPIDLPHLRQHGRAGGAGRSDRCRPPQFSDAERRPRFRARRHRRLLHRRRLGVRRRRKVMGVVIGAFVMGVMNNGMSIYGLGIYWQQVVKGVVLLTAVYVDLYQKSKE